MIKRNYVVYAICGGLLLAVMLVPATRAEDDQKSRDGLQEPVLREEASVAGRTAPKSGGHPLDPAIEYAHNGMKTIQTGVADYTCTLVKRERINNKLGEPEYMFVKVRNRKTQSGKVVTPLSVYMYFLKPADMKGREVIYVEGQNSNKLVAHEGGGIKSRFLPTVWLRPDSALAMRGQKYPITEVGIENLVAKLIERGERDRKLPSGNVDVAFHKDAKVNGRSCTLLQVKHAKPSPNIDFHMAQIFIDDETNLPIRYAAYGFPSREGEPLPVIEEYTYLNVKINVGLTDKDFDHTNREYAFK